MQLSLPDTFTASPAALMAVVPADPYQLEIWPEFQAVIERNELWFQGFETLERMAFYEKARQVYTIVATGERRRYANIILQKGIIEPEA
jgi:L-fucose mutarotase